MMITCVYIINGFNLSYHYLYVKGRITDWLNKWTLDTFKERKKHTHINIICKYVHTIINYNIISWVRQLFLIHHTTISMKYSLYILIQLNGQDNLFNL